MSSSRTRWHLTKRICMAEIGTLKKINLRDVWQDEGSLKASVRETCQGLVMNVGAGKAGLWWAREEARYVG